MNRIVISLLLLLTSSLFGKTVCIVPFAGCPPETLFFSTTPLNYPFTALRQSLEERGYTVRYALNGLDPDEVVAVISLTRIEGPLLEQLSAYPKEKRLLFCFEPPVVMPHLYHEWYTTFFGKIFVLLDHLPHYHKFYYPQPPLKRTPNIPSFGQKKLCCLINNNKDFSHPSALYPERRKIISFFASLPSGEFDLFGGWWHGYRDWKGTVESKWETFKHYKFCICFENMHWQEGYITEKIFDAFIGGCVPVYWGAENITDYVPKECFIDRRLFASDEELYTFLKTMDETTYSSYQEAIECFLQSPQAHLFSTDYFIDLITTELTALE